MLQCQFFGMDQYFVDASAGFHGSGDGKIGVHFQIQISRYIRETVMHHIRNPAQRGFDNSVRSRSLRKTCFDQWCKPPEPGIGIIDIGLGQRGSMLCSETWIDPQKFLSAGQLFQLCHSCLLQFSAVSAVQRLT